MSYIIQPSDFGGSSVYKLPQDTLTVDRLQSIIDEWEQRNLRYLLGGVLYELFIADLVNGVPQSQRFINIYEPFFYTEYGCVIESEGMKTMLLGLVWGRYVELYDVSNTTQGTKSLSSANSENIGLQNSKMYDFYNNGVDSYRAIQYAICQNSTDYPEFEGVYIDKKTWL